LQYTTAVCNYHKLISYILYANVHTYVHISVDNIHNVKLTGSFGRLPLPSLPYNKQTKICIVVTIKLINQTQ